MIDLFYGISYLKYINLVKNRIQSLTNQIYIMNFQINLVNSNYNMINNLILILNIYKIVMFSCFYKDIHDFIIFFYIFNKVNQLKKLRNL